MLPEIWEPDLTVVFVGTAVTELSDTLGFYHLHPRSRFWELLEIGGITPQRIITAQERKALEDGHRQGSLSDPVRVIFTQKKTSQLLRLGIGLTDLNRRIVVESEKDKAARPTADDITGFCVKVGEKYPRILAFVTPVDIFVSSFKVRYPDVTDVLGPQPFAIGKAEVWLLGFTSGPLRGEALTRQEDAFFALGERITELRGKSPAG